MTKFYTYILTALMSLFASSLAVFGVLINLTKQQELVERRHVAARAVLPLTLSRLNELTECGFETVLQVSKLRAGPPEEAFRQLENLRIPIDDIQQIRECIEAADVETQEWLSLILAHWQLETSRLKTQLLEPNMIQIPHQLANSAMDWLTIRAMIIHLFDYSRPGHIPDAALNAKFISVPIHSQRLADKDLADARTHLLVYINGNGGWSYKGFKKRFITGAK